MSSGGRHGCGVDGYQRISKLCHGAVRTVDEGLSERKGCPLHIKTGRGFGFVGRVAFSRGIPAFLSGLFRGNQDVSHLNQSIIWSY